MANSSKRNLRDRPASMVAISQTTRMDHARALESYGSGDSALAIPQIRVGLTSLIAPPARDLQ
jgi:hypothetical protein